MPSLTGELRTPSSRVGEYIRFVGTMVADAGTGILASEYKHFLGLDALPKDVKVPPVSGANSGMVGTAFDYRLRYHLAPCKAREFVAWYGALALGSSDPFTEPQLRRFFASLDGLATQLSPAGRSLDDGAEHLLDAYCVVLAQLEAVYRSGGAWVPELPRSDVESTPPDEEPLLQLAPKAAVEDVMNLSRSAEGVFGDLIRLVASGTLAYLPNPIFGNASIAADGDLIISGSLFDLKTNKTLDAPAIRNALLQLIGYALLDYDDHYEIRQVGLYFARHEWLTMWPLWEFVFPPADVLLHSLHDTEPTDDEINRRLVLEQAFVRTGWPVLLV